MTVEELERTTMLYRPIAGAGGGGQQSGSSTPPTNTPDTLRSADSVEIILALCEGEIVGLANGAQTFFVGDTALENADTTLNFEYFQLDIRPGLPVDTADFLTPVLGGTSSSISVNTVLASETPVVRQMSENQLDAIDLRFNVAQLYRSDSSGVFTYELDLIIEIKKETDTIWLPAFGNATLPIKGKTTSTYVKELRIPVARTDDFWQIRVTKASADSTVDLTSDGTGIATDVTWDSYQMINMDLKKYPDTATCRIFAQATNQFSSIPQFSGIYKLRIVNVPSNYDPVNRTYTGTWDGTFIKAYTNNPAWVTYDFVTNTRFGMSAVTQLNMDKYEVYAIAQWCDTLVDDGIGGFRPRYTLNLLITDASPAIDMGRYMAGTFNATMFDDNNGTIIMRADMNQDATHLFTPENITSDGFTYSFTDINSRYNTITVSFLNPDLNYQEDRRLVINQDHIDAFGPIPLDFIAVGCTSEVEAVARANYKLITSITECMICTFKTNRLGTVVEPYEVILIGDPLNGYSLTGRIKSLNVARTTVTLRDAIHLEVGTNYVLQLRIAGGVSTTSYTVTVPSSGSVTAFNVSPALPDNLPESCVFSLSQNPGEGIGAPKPFRALKVEEIADDPDHIQITCIEVNRNKFTDAETGVVSTPTQFSGIGDPSSIPGPTNVAFFEKYNLIGNEVWTILTVTLPRDQYRYYTGDFLVYSRQLDTSNGDAPLGSFEQRVVQYGDTIVNHPPGLFEFKVLPKNSFGQTPPIGSVASWTHEVSSAEAAGTPPDPVEDVTYQLTQTGFIVQWNPPTGQATVVHHYQVKEGADEGSATVIADNLKDPILVLDPMTKRVYNLFIYAVSLAGVPSTAVNVTITNAAPGVVSNIQVDAGYETVMVFFDRSTEVDIVGYRIQYRVVGDVDWLDMDPSGLLDSVIPDTAYEFRVAAQDSLTILLGDEIWSTPRSIRTADTVGVAKGIDDVQQSTTQNLVRNGSFERGSQNWTFDTAATAIDAAAPYVDFASGTTTICTIGDGSASTASILSDTFVVRANQQYAIGADCRANASHPGESHIFTLKVYDGSNNLVMDYDEDHGKVFFDAAQLSTDTFMRLTSVFMIPAGGIYGRIYVEARGAGIVDVDGVQAQRGAVATAFNPYVAELLSPGDLGLISNPDQTPPGIPTALSAFAGFRTVQLSFTPPADADVDHYDVFRSTTDDISTALQVGASVAPVYVDSATLTGVEYFYWVRAVDRSGNDGDFTDSVSATTIPLAAADFQNLSIVNAMIADATIDDAKIADLSVGKLTAGTITAGEILLGNDRFIIDSSLRRLTVQDDLNVARVLLGRLGNGAQDYGIQIYGADGTLIIGADGLGVAVVGAGNLADGSVTADKIVANAISVDKMAANSVTALQLTTNSVTSAAIVAGAVSADKMSVATLSAITANVGTLTAGLINSGSSPTTNYWNLDTGAFSVGKGDGSTYMRYNPTTGAIEIQGVITATNALPTNWLDVQGRPANLNDLDPTASGKLATIAPGADVTGANTSANTNAVGQLTTAQAVAAMLDPATTINQNSTTINGAKITTGTVIANLINVATLSALAANVGTLTAGLLRNGANTAFMNLDASGTQQFLKCGNNFSVDALGNVNMTSGSISGNLIVAGSITAGQIAGNGLSESGQANNEFTVTVGAGEKIIIFPSVLTPAHFFNKNGIGSPAPAETVTIGPITNRIIHIADNVGDIVSSITSYGSLTVSPLVNFVGNALSTGAVNSNGSYGVFIPSAITITPPVGTHTLTLYILASDNSGVNYFRINANPTLYGIVSMTYLRLKR